MKRIKPVLLLLFLSSITSLSAQDNAISKYFSDYLFDTQFEQFKVTENSFDQIAKMKSEDFQEQQTIDAIGDLEGVLVLMNEKTNNSFALYQKATATIAAEKNYEELASLSHGKENFQILLREELNTIREFLLIAGGQEHFVIASLYGDIDVPTIMQFSKVLRKSKINKDWFELIEDQQTKELRFNADQLGAPTLTIGEENMQFKDITVYPNIVQDQVQIKDAKGKNEVYQLTFYTLLGEPIQMKDQVTLPYTLEFNNLPAGAYFIRLTNPSGAYKNFRILKP